MAPSFDSKRGTSAIRVRSQPDFDARRADMVRHHLAARGIGDERVLEAMGSVPREAFVPQGQRRSSYADRALPLGFGQTVSQPYVVAVTLQALRLEPTDRILEVGAGSGYAAAVASRLVTGMVAVERIERLATAAAERLRALGFNNVTVVWGDGATGHPPAAPYDAIFLSAATPAVPDALFGQLAPGGRLVAPVGPAGSDQQLALYERPPQTVGSPDETAHRATRLLPVAFVPLLPGLRPGAK